MADDNPLQKLLDDAKALLTTAEKDRDTATAEVTTVKKQGEKVLDDNAVLSRQLDEAKKNIANLIKGLPAKKDPAPGDPPAPAGEKKESLFALANRWLDKAWHFPYVPPEKKSDS